ncbi:mediator of RNA polymerase II transcription subunit 31 [Petaurus breviceps papuanus]|uniref:mediator of RNA polymerase II transcription subunit 31 n=1 Tax=Petaurus breviceps papuanus TaxID=3040969 RepID=UPI0036DC941F
MSVSGTPPRPAPRLVSFSSVAGPLVPGGAGRSWAGRRNPGVRRSSRRAPTPARGAPPPEAPPLLLSHKAPRHAGAWARTRRQGLRARGAAGAAAGAGRGGDSFMAASAVVMETSDDAGNRLRFQLELEFVQCLANPNYLNFLAQRGYFKDKAFVNYLKYLLYWKEPDYAKYLKYPQCLHMLELLQYEHFRKELVNAQCAKFIDEQQILHWQHYSRKRMRLQQALAEQQQQPPQQLSSSSSSASSAGK